MASLPLAVGAGLAAGALTLAPLRGLPREGEVPRASRSPADAAFHGVIGVLSIGLLYLGAATPGLLAGFEPFRSQRWLLEASASVALLLAVSPLLAIAGASRSREALPGPRAPLGAAVLQAVGRFALAIGPFLAFEWAVIAAARQLGQPAAAQPTLVDFLAQDLGMRAWIVLRVAVAHPIAEEAVFRGTIQPSLAPIVGPRAARIVSSAMFAMVHPPIALVPMLVLGYFFARVRDAHGRIVPSIVLHGLYNGLTLALFASAPFVRDLFDPAVPR